MRHQVITGISVGLLNSQINTYENAGWELIPETVQMVEKKDYSEKFGSSVDNVWTAVMRKNDED